MDAHLPFREFELARPTPDGGKRYVSVSGLPLFDKTGCFIGYRGVGRHVTERKKAEEALRRSEAYLAEAQRLSHTGTVAFSARRQFTGQRRVIESGALIRCRVSRTGKLCFSGSIRMIATE